MILIIFAQSYIKVKMTDGMFIQKCDHFKQIQLFQNKTCFHTK